MLVVSFLIAYLNHPLCFFLIRLTYIYLVCMCVCVEKGRGGGGGRRSMLQRNHLFLNTQHKYSVYVLLSFVFVLFCFVLFCFVFLGGGGIKWYQGVSRYDESIHHWKTWLSILHSLTSIMSLVESYPSFTFISLPGCSVSFFFFLPTHVFVNTSNTLGLSGHYECRIS